jgi:hypothetical protein
MGEHRPIVCTRCLKPFADEGEEVLVLAGKVLVLIPESQKLISTEGLSADELSSALDHYSGFAEKFCVCEKRPRSEFTSSPQPPNLDDIERNMK